MKNFWKMYSRNLGFWLLVYAFLTTITIIVMASVWSRHECPNKPEPVDKYRKEIQTLKDKINDYEIKKIQNTIDIDNMSDSERDSLRATINPR